MSTVEKETGVAFKNVQESSHTIKQEVLSGDEMCAVKQERSLKRKKEEPVTQKRKKKKKKSSNGETVAEVGPTVSKEEKTFNWRSHQWKTAINIMNCRIVSVLTPYMIKNECNGQEKDADSSHHRVSHKTMESDIVQLPSLDVPTDWILKSSHVER